MRRGGAGGRAAAAGACLVGRFAPLRRVGLTGCARFRGEGGAGEGSIEASGGHHGGWSRVVVVRVCGEVWGECSRTGYELRWDREESTYVLI